MEMLFGGAACGKYYFIGSNDATNPRFICFADGCEELATRRRGLSGKLSSLRGLIVVKSSELHLLAARNWTSGEGSGHEVELLLWSTAERQLPHLEAAINLEFCWRFDRRCEVFLARDRSRPEMIMFPSIYDPRASCPSHLAMEIHLNYLK
jgi:hypothetical protein